MAPDDWSDDDDIARWEALEAAARAEQREPPPVLPAPVGAPIAVDDGWQAPPGPVTAHPAEAETAAPDAGASTVGADILLADADAAIGASIEQAMADRGWVVRRVADGDLALAEFRRRPPDCFVFDYSLPRLGGLDLVRKLTEPGVGDGARLVVNSTQTQTILVQRALALGVDRFLDRPRRSPDKLVDAVAEQLADAAASGTADAGTDTEPAAAAPGPEAGGPELFGSTPPAPAGSERSEPDPLSVRERRSYRSAFGSGGGPPGRVPRLS